MIPNKAIDNRPMPGAPRYMRVCGVKKTALWVALAVFLGGCSLTPHQLNLSPNAPAALRPIEQATTVVLSFVDQRAVTEIGHRLGSTTAEITTTDLMGVVETAVRDLFVRKGYHLVAAGAPHDARILVGVKTFRYDTKHNVLTWEESVSVEIVLESEKQHRKLRKVYRSNSQQDSVFEAFGGKIDRRMSRVLSDILTQIAQDPELEQFLTG